MTILCFSIVCLIFGKWYGEWCYKKYLHRNIGTDHTIFLFDGDYFIVPEEDFLELMPEGYIYNRSTVKVTKQYEI